MTQMVPSNESISKPCELEQAELGGNYAETPPIASIFCLLIYNQGEKWRLFTPSRHLLAASEGLNAENHS